MNLAMCLKFSLFPWCNSVQIYITVTHATPCSENDFEVRISALTEQAAEVKKTIRELSDKNKQYKDVAKYLLTYNQYLPIEQEAASKSIFQKKKFIHNHEGELAALEHAAAQLEKRGVNSNVDPDKVLNLVKDHDSKIDELSAALKSTTGKIDALRAARQLVNDIAKGEPAPKSKKTKERDER